MRAIEYGYQCALQLDTSYTLCFMDLYGPLNLAYNPGISHIQLLSDECMRNNVFDSSTVIIQRDAVVNKNLNVTHFGNPV
jgi:hypothetical protein